MVVIHITSGIFTGEPSKLYDKVKRAYIRSIILGVRETITEYLPSVAMDTGQLRADLETMMKNQLIGIEGKTLNKLAFKSLKLDYAKYHVIGPHGDLNPKFKSGYRNPTTAGTKPISESEFMGIMKDKIINRIRFEIQQAEGLEMSLSVID